MKRTIKAIKIFLAGNFALKATKIGAPITTPNAYVEIKCPATGILIFKSFATSGSNPIIANSVVPIARPPKARGNNCFVIILSIFYFKYFLQF